MTITASFQSISVSAMRLSIAARPAGAAPTAITAPSTPATGGDSVSLSPAATVPTATESGQTTATPAPTTNPATSASTSPLLAALDTDKDGAMSKDEFTSGALALLGRRGDHPRTHGNGDGDNGRRARGVPGLERRLEKAFDRVDANDDGSVDEGELTTALAGRGGSTPDVPPTPTSTAEPQSSVQVAFVSVTYVSVAVQRYSLLQAAAPSSTTSTSAPPTVPAEPTVAAA